MSPTCESCGGRAEEIANPYYGKALAVHDRVIVCSLCGHVQFPETGVVRPSEPAGQGLFARLRRWLRRG